MVKGHVGRPTNEEVASRKRKKLLKILLPCGIVAIVAIMIISQTSITKLVGNSTCEFVCDEGWDRSGSVCTKTSSSNYITKAYLIGDANYDGKVTLEDYATIKNSIVNKVDLDNTQQTVYDLNQDGEVNNYDIQDFDLNSTSGAVTSSQKYVCPKETIEEQTDGDQTLNTTIKYELNETNCNTTSTVVTTKKATQRCVEQKTEEPKQQTSDSKKHCMMVDGKEECFEHYMPLDCKTVNGIQVCGEEIPETVDDVSDDDEYLNDDEKSDVIDESEYLDDSDALENVEDDDEEDDDDSLAIYDIKSNYLNYLNNEQCTKDRKCVEYVDSNGYPIAGQYQLLGYDNTQCQNNKNSIDFGVNEAKNGVANITFSSKWQKKIHRIPFEGEFYSVNLLNKVKCIKMMKYNRKTGSENVGQSSINIYENGLGSVSVMKIVDKTLNTGQVNTKVSYSFVDKYDVSGKTSVASQTFVEFPGEYKNSKKTDGYSFAGWVIKRTSKNKTEILCYKDASKKYLTWETVTDKDPNCNVAPKVIGSKKNIKKNVSSYISQNSNYGLVFASRWTNKQTIKVQFQNNKGKDYTSKKKSSLKNVSLKLFKSKSDCTNNKGAIITKHSKKNTSYKFKKTLASNQYYYLRVASTKATVRKADQCQRITLQKHNKAKEVKVRFDAAIYKITYKLDGGKNNSKNPKNYTKKTKTITLKSATKKGYTFKGWYTKKSGGTKIDKIKKGSTGNLTLYAHWKKKK